MTLDGRETLVGGEPRDFYGRPEYLLVPKHTAPTSTDVIRGYQPADPDGRPQIVIQDINGNSLASSAVVNMPPPSGDTTGATDGAALTAALAALPSGKGIVQLQAGAYRDNVSRTLGSYQILQGAGGLSAGAAPGTILVYTGTAASYLNMQAAVAAQIRDVMVFASNASFTGRLIDLSASATLCRIERCALFAADTTTAQIIYLDNGQDAVIYGCNIVGGLIGIQGIATAAHFSNAISVIGNRIGGQGAGGAGISSVGTGWNISGNIFERNSGERGIASGLSGGGGPAGVDISGNWFGDSTGSSASIEVFCNGMSIRGNYIGSSSSGKGVQFTGTSDGILIAGNRFDTASIGIDKNGQTVTSIGLGPNSYTNVTTRHNFTAGGTLYIEA